jgi:EAL domain-containing protein (putative c-di-GMP-specific phosphodiesterase class I)
MLRNVPIDFVKVDGSIMKDACNGGASRAALMAILAFSSEAGALVVAEGVEDQSMLGLVHELAKGPVARSLQLIHCVQGYLLGRPAPGFEAAEDDGELAA